MNNAHNYQYVTQAQEQQNDEKWYESLWGLVILTLGVNLFSNWLYDKGREKTRLKDQLLERKRERKHLERQHGKTPEEAHKEESDIYNDVGI